MHSQKLGVGLTSGHLEWTALGLLKEGNWAWERWGKVCSSLLLTYIIVIGNLSVTPCSEMRAFLTVSKNHFNKSRIDFFFTSSKCVAVSR